VSKLQGPNLRVVFYEGSGSTPLPAEERFQAISALLDNGFEVSRPVNGGSVSRADASPVLLLGRFEGGRAPTVEGAVQSRDLSGMTADQVLGAAREARERSGARKLEAWKPWFPVIDYDRCTNCMQCLTFCLFDVYGVDKQDKIQVQNNDNCKTDCPACSRVCPEVAILFPKYKAGPINGDVVKQEDVKKVIHSSSVILRKLDNTKPMRYLQLAYFAGIPDCPKFIFAQTALAVRLALQDLVFGKRKTW